MLLTAAILWGFAFVAQRQGMKYVGPFLFNGFRFILGALVILPFSGLRFSKKELQAGILLGIVLFLAATLQQIGIIYTTAGKAGFITGLYMIFVPILGAFSGDNASLRTWMGIAIAVGGLYLLSIHGRIDIALGDSLLLLCAIIFALHVRMVGIYTRLFAPFKLAFLQFAVCGLLSLAGWGVIENAETAGLSQAIIPILYGGLISVGIAYTLQFFAQRRAPAADCAVILSLEGAFAVIGGYLILHEMMSTQSLIGCLLMLVGAILAGLPERRSLVKAE
ncbi:MAG: DMT family transporter [Candidatus Stygibacter australis]|nr:DMT family transporter [Candidatus Stygibacter australis]MDP8322912.1 DMT family transporter [Candidatus Stygibacter australis]